MGGEYCDHGDDGSGQETGRGHVPGEDRDDGVSSLLVSGKSAGCGHEKLERRLLACT